MAAYFIVRYFTAFLFLNILVFANSDWPNVRSGKAPAATGRGAASVAKRGASAEWRGAAAAWRGEAGVPLPQGSDWSDARSGEAAEALGRSAAAVGRGAAGDALPQASNNENEKYEETELILKNAPWNVKLLLLKDMDPNDNGASKLKPMRRVGIQSLTHRRQSPDMQEPAPDQSTDEKHIRLKLFRLMYETVRDSDLKVKRAELIRQYYNNSPPFEIGYLMGEVQEKFDVINEFAATLRKYYSAWKPVEHINAYEQIANYGIQINQLVDLIKATHKGDAET